MCWITYRKPELMTAEKDIEVFKIVKEYGGDIVSLFDYNPVKYGEIIGGKIYDNRMIEGECVVNPDGDTFNTVMDTPYHPVTDKSQYLICPSYEDDGMFMCSKGFHSYSSKCCTPVRVDNTRWQMINIISDGAILHKYMRGFKLTFVMNCVIPKGARYYVNENNEYVSESLKVLSFNDTINLEIMYKL